MSKCEAEKLDDPLPTIWLDPHCAECQDGISWSDMTWSMNPDQPDCEICGHGPIPYHIAPGYTRNAE